MRKVATVQRVKAIEEMLDKSGQPATSVELVTFEDVAWQCVAKKGEFKVGDKAVYIEISSVVPETEVFEFLRPSKFRVKTKKILGYLSQGLALPLSTFGIDAEVGDDVSEQLGIKRWEPESDPERAKLGGTTKGNFHPDVPKTDEERIQSAPGILKLFTGLDVVATVKVDGTSVTYLFEDSGLKVYSRNLQQDTEGDTVYAKVAKVYGIAEILEKFPWIALQGEIAGPGIQENKLGLKEHELFLFNAFNFKTQVYMPHIALATFCRLNKLPMVPVFKTWTAEEWEQAAYTVDDLLELSKGRYASGKHREGLVFRPMSEEVYTRFGRLSFKVINNDFLLSGGE